MPTTAAEEKIPAKKITETPTPKAEKPPANIRPPISDEKKASGPTPIRESAPQVAPKPTAKPLPPPQKPPRQQPAFPSSPLPTAEIPATASMPLPGVATPIAPSFPPKQMLGKNYVVQLGVFNDTEAAKELIEKLNKAGIRAHLETRVQIGPFNSRKEAEKAQAEMRKLGYKALVTLPYPTR
jgi:DedD protein